MLSYPTGRGKLFMCFMDDSKEWRDVVGYEGKYKVSEDGSIYSLLTNMVLKTNYCGLYPSIKLTKDGVQFQMYIHTVVAAAFLGERLDGYDINHIDGVKTNNHYSNLEYCAHGENIRHAVANGLLAIKGEKHPNSLLTNAQVLAIKNRLDNGERICHLAREHKISEQAIADIKHKRKWAWLLNS